MLIFILILIAVALFLLFLPNVFELEFSNGCWNICVKNLFFRYRGKESVYPTPLKEEKEYSQIPTTASELLVFVKDFWKAEKKLVKAALKFAVKIIKLSLRLLAPAKIKVNVCGGLDDSAETAWLYSAFILFNSFFEGNKRIALNFTPQFYDAKWEFSGKISYCVSIAKLLLFVLAVLLCVPYYRLIKYLWRTWRKKRRKN